MLPGAGSGVQRPIGEAVLQIDMMLGKERKVNVRGQSVQDTVRTFKLEPQQEKETPQCVCVRPVIAVNDMKWQTSGMVPPLRGRLGGRALPRRQEAEAHHEVQEQQLDGEVQRGVPVVSFRNPDACS